MSTPFCRRLSLIALLAAAACGGGEKAPPANPPADQPAAAPAPAAPTDTASTTTRSPAVVPAAAPAASPASAAPGPDAYAICSTCHQANGEGLPNTFPPLAGSEYVNGPGATHIAIVLKGLTGPITVKGKTYNSVMTPWESLSDAQIAAAINYERASWGNTGAPVTSADVAKVRVAIKSRTTSWTADELKKAKLQ